MKIDRTKVRPSKGRMKKIKGWELIPPPEPPRLYTQAQLDQSVVDAERRGIARGEREERARKWDAHQTRYRAIQRLMSGLLETIFARSLVEETDDEG